MLPMPLFIADFVSVFNLYETPLKLNQDYRNETSHFNVEFC